MKNFNAHNCREKAFTLLEMLIVLSIVGILLSTIFSILFVVLRQQVRIARIIETRRQGDSILNFMKERIVRASSIENDAGTEICTAPVLPATFTTYAAGNGDDYVFVDGATEYKFRLPPGTTTLLYSDANTLVDSPLHNTRVTVTGFSIQCRRNASTTTALVQFAYTVTFVDPTATAGEGTTVLTYRSKVKLR